MWRNQMTWQDLAQLTNGGGRNEAGWFHYYTWNIIYLFSNQISNSYHGNTMLLLEEVTDAEWAKCMFRNNIVFPFHICSTHGVFQFPKA